MIQEIKKVQGKKWILISLLCTFMMITVIAPSVLGQKTDFMKEDQINKIIPRKPCELSNTGVVIESSLKIWGIINVKSETMKSHQET